MDWQAEVANPVISELVILIVADVLTQCLAHQNRRYLKNELEASQNSKPSTCLPYMGGLNHQKYGWLIIALTFAYNFYNL